MTKTELVTEIAERAACPRPMARSVLDEMLNIVQEHLEKGDPILVPKFGKFFVRERKGREGCNPQTTQRMPISPSRVVVFRAGTRLRNAVRGALD